MLAVMVRHHRTTSPFAILLAFTAALTPVSCKAPQAFGDRHSIIVRADSALWLQVDSVVLSAVERPVFTSRNETEFKVTFVADVDTVWNNLRLWQQVVVLANAEDDVAQRIIRASGAPQPAAPAVVQAADIWARGQLVKLVLLPETGGPEAVASQMEELYTVIREGYDNWVLERMYASGVNDSLKEVLSAYGFSLDLPQVYVHAREDSTFRFRNVHPDPGTRIRAFLVSWRTGGDPLAEDAGTDGLRAWREEVGETLYNPPQDITEDGVRYDTVAIGVLTGVEMRGVWRDRASFPAGGPFIARAVGCPDQDRTYYIDAWLYNPADDKYPYLRQLEIILDTFACAEEEPVQISASSATR